MAKKARSPAASQDVTTKKPASADVPTTTALGRGTELFAKRDYDGAFSAWGEVVSSSAPTSEASALARCNRAACHMIAKRWDDAVSECSAALIAQPNFHKALVRRARAYEQLGQVRQALADLARANRLDAATPESRASEERVRAALAKREAARPAAPQGERRQVTFRAKVAFGDDLRQVVLHPAVTYVELLEQTKATFPSAVPFAIKYADAEGEWVTIGSRADIQLAMQESFAAATRVTDKGAPVHTDDLPPLRFRVDRVASEADVPPPPEEEIEYVRRIVEQLRAEQARQAAEGGEEGDGEGGAAAPPAVDEWILSFVELLKEHCGVDADRPLEASEVGNDRLQAAFQAMLIKDAEKSAELLDVAADKFGDQVCYGMYNQGSVELYRAEFLTYEAARNGTPASEVAKAASAHLDKADAHHSAALAYKPAFIDGFLGRSAVEQARAKLASGYLLEPLAPKVDVKDPKERAEAEDAASKEAQKRAAARVTKASALAAEPHCARSVELIEAAIAAMPAEEREKELTPMKPTAEQVQGDPSNEIPLRATLLINLGNAHYEHSILRAAAGADWRPLVERAAELFREAGAHQTDIRAALKGHPKAAEIEDLIGPEPEEDKPEATTEEGKSAEAKEDTAAKKLETEEDVEVIEKAEADEAKGAEAKNAGAKGSAGAAKPKGLPALPKKNKKGGARS